MFAKSRNATHSPRRALSWLACLAWFLASTRAGATDKVTMACIQSAEDGQRSLRAGRLLGARSLFAQCAARECPTVLRHDCATWLDDARRQTPSIVIGAHDAHGRDVSVARAYVDGALVTDHLEGNPIELDPGARVVRVASSDVSAVEVRVVLRAGEKNRPILALLAAPTSDPSSVERDSPAPGPDAGPPRRLPAATWVLGSVGLAGLGAFAYFGATGMAGADDLRATCSPGCTDSQVSRVHAKLLAADVGLGVGLLSLGAATWVGIHAWRRPPKAAAWDVVVLPSAHATRAELMVAF